MKTNEFKKSVISSTFLKNVDNNAIWALFQGINRCGEYIELEYDLDAKVLTKKVNGEVRTMYPYEKTIEALLTANEIYLEELV